MPGQKRTPFAIAAALANKAIANMAEAERHWKPLTEAQREKITAPLEQALSRLKDPNNRVQVIDTTE